MLNQRGGKFGDQAYLNDWPERFEGVVVSQLLGVGVAPWNQERWAFSAGPAGAPLVNGEPIIFYHFHNFKMVEPRVIVPITSVEYPLTPEILKLCMLPYINTLWRGIVEITRVLEEFNCGFRFASNGAPPVEMEQTFLVARSVASNFSGLELPHRQIELDSAWVCFASQRQMPQG